MGICCRVALLGFGTVGSAVARRLTTADPDSSPEIQRTHIFDRHAAEKSAWLAAPGVAWTSSIDEVLQSSADVIVEAVGGVEPAAARQGRPLRFEAAVGGAMPIVHALGEGLTGDRITRVVAILNGTTNAVLTQVEETGCALGVAVADAQRRGYAEADPSLDFNGDDARAKPAILCALAFGLRVNPLQIDAQSSASVTPEDLARAWCNGGTVRQIAHSGETGIFGVGASGDATAVAILGDLRAIARDKAAIAPARILDAQFTILNFVLAEAV